MYLVTVQNGWLNIDSVAVDSLAQARDEINLYLEVAGKPRIEDVSRLMGRRFHKFSGLRVRVQPIEMFEVHISYAKIDPQNRAATEGAREYRRATYATLETASKATETLYQQLCLSLGRIADHNFKLTGEDIWRIKARNGVYKLIEAGDHIIMIYMRRMEQ